MSGEPAEKTQAKEAEKPATDRIPDAETIRRIRERFL
jgi:hypothetical protein